MSKDVTSRKRNVFLVVAFTPSNGITFSFEICYHHRKQVIFKTLKLDKSPYISVSFVAQDLRSLSFRAITRSQFQSIFHSPQSIDLEKDGLLGPPSVSRPPRKTGSSATFVAATEFPAAVLPLNRSNTPSDQIITIHAQDNFTMKVHKNSSIDAI